MLHKPPYAQLWQPFMEKYTGETPFGKPCHICLEILLEKDHENTQVIENNNFLSPSYVTPEMYQKNICVCGSTTDCYDDSVMDWTFHLTHYFHRSCFELYIKSGYDVCPMLKAYYDFIGDTPVHLTRVKQRTLRVSEEAREITGDVARHMSSINSEWATAVSDQLVNLDKKGIKYKSLQAYTQFFDGPINGGFRSHYMTLLAYQITLQIISYLDNVTPYPEEICLYRGLKNKSSVRFMQNMQGGEIFETRGFSSQSLSIKAALGFTDDPPRIMVLCYPAGTKFLDVHHVSKYENEWEMLTYPNQRIQFVEKKEMHDAYGNVMHFYYYNVFPSRISLENMIADKQLFISHNYDLEYQKFDISKGSPFDVAYKYQIIPKPSGNRRHIFIRRDLPLDNEYYERMLEDSPQLISDLIRVFAGHWVLPRMCLIALSKDFTVYNAVVAHISDEVSRIQHILDHELDYGYVLNQYIAPKHMNDALRSKVLANSPKSIEFLL